MISKEIIIELFNHQYINCEPYQQWCDLIGVTPLTIKEGTLPPFLPIELFRTKKIYCSTKNPELIFSSSGTTSTETSYHYVAKAQQYIDSFINGFMQFYGEPQEWSIFALLPNYLERTGSSLVYMVEYLHNKNPTKGGFYINDLYKLEQDLIRAIGNSDKIMIIGVTFALVDFCEKHNILLTKGSVVIETGGMKGRLKEIERSILHDKLKQSFGVDTIHSEYGMTELLSQAYSCGDGIFNPSSTMQVLGRALDNPLRTGVVGAVCGINVIDVSNVDSCSFIEIGDRGIVYADGSFEVLGRIESEILRGCNML